MAGCDNLYNSKDKIRIKIPLNQALRNNSIELFIKFITKYNPSKQQVRLVPHEGDTENDIILSLRALDSDIQDILRSWDALHPSSPQFDSALSKIRNALNLIDESQTLVPDNDDVEIKTKKEIVVATTSNLQKHLTEFYGLESFDIINGLKQKFEDILAGACYYDVNSGIISDQTTDTLNKNIKTEKDKLFNNVVQYLKATYPDDIEIQKLKESMYPNDKFDSQNFYKALNLFYSKVAKSETFQDELKASHIENVKGTNKSNKEVLYKNLVKELLKGNLFKAKMSHKFKGKKFSNLQEQLYSADHYSEYYAAVKTYIEKYKPEFIGSIIEIEKPVLNLLTVSNSYTMLRHFDNLVKEVYSEQISIAKNTEGYEADIKDKYTYHKDTTHEIKGWQTSIDIGSEKHISKFTNAVINMIRIYDYKTGEFTHRRLDSTSLIVAARNLINAVNTNKVTFRNEADSVKNASNELIQHCLEFHNNPVEHLQKILELMFERVPNTENPLNYYIENKQAINEYDLSVLKSVYNVVFKADNPTSFYSQSAVKVKNNSTHTQSLLEEIAGYVDRNVSALYLESSVDFETGTPVIKSKKKFFSDKQLYKLQTKINMFVNKMPWNVRTDLQNKYNIRIEEGKNNTLYTVTIGNEDIALSIPNNISGQILSKSSKKGHQFKFETTGDLFNRLNNINLIDFRKKVESGANLNSDETTLYNVLKFLDDTLDLGFISNPTLGLQTLYSYQQLFNSVDGFNNYLQPLLKLGIRAAYANMQYIQAGENANLATYLTESNNPIYQFYKTSKNSKLFSSRFFNVQYTIASYADEVLNALTEAQSILQGEAAKATTKDKQGNSIPNNSISKLGSILHYYLGKQWNSNTDSLLFVKNRDMLVNVYHDLEVTNKSNTTKNIKEFSGGELFFHAIFNKFWGGYLSTGNVIIQPTAYSDKTTFLNWEIKPLLDNIDIVRADKDTILELYQNTIGATYSRVFDSTTEKLVKIANQFALDNNITDTMNFKQILHMMSESDFVSTAAKVGVDVELNKDYRIIKNREGKKVIGVNELIEYNANLYNDLEGLNSKLEKEKGLFLEHLLLNNCTYQVLTGNDTIEMYTDDKISELANSHNPILNTILEYYANDVESRKAYMMEWVDSFTGKMILAKQNDIDIINSSDVFDKDSSIELNPLLNKFFYVEGLLSNNLRYSLTGLEINHPAGKKSIFNKALTAQTLEDWNKLGIKKLTTKGWETLKSILDTCLDIDDFNINIARNQSTLSKSVKEAASKLLLEAYNYATNTSQGTQFKRNVSIVATLQHCLQQSLEGIPSKVKCAVIRDEQAPVFNYRGDHESDIDSCDGSAQITPFQCIMENRALGSQAVGFVKKPIWHAYDSNSGTAFLAKFATTTMTNEAMRMSLVSNTRLFKLFKKATNLQWGIPIDLTKSIVVNQSLGGQDINNAVYNQWIQNVIFGKNKLYYQNKYGDIIEILGFNKETLSNGKVIYYTLEKSKSQSMPVRKYHIFYDENTDSDIDGKSIHFTTDSIEQAESFINDYSIAGKNPHTINSLFELHTAFGGIYCTDSKGNDSEYNNEVVVNFMNNVGWAKSGTQKNDIINQSTYVTPLKDFHIGYLLNNTAVKNGVKNINQSSVWGDNSDLMYFEVDSDGLGMQMNADHDIVDSEITEFSQVIAATAAYGYTYDNTSEIFEGLARAAFQASEKTIKATAIFIHNMDGENKSKAISELYDSVGRIVLMNQSIKDRESLTNIIMSAVQNIFNKYSNHENDKVKIPFSDPNIYSDFIATLASTITRQSVIRKHTGSGSVMVPSYNMIQYFEIPNADGTYSKVMADDILKKARTDYRSQLIRYFSTQPDYNVVNNSIKIGDNIKYLNTESLEGLEKLALQLDPTGSFSNYYNTLQDITIAGEHIINTYLNQFKNTEKDISYFIPSDIVEVIDESGNIIETVDLDTLDKYYKFKQGIDSMGNPYNSTYTFRISTTKPHNLRPSLIRWQYLDDSGNIRYMNAFDLPVIKNAYLNNTNRSANHRMQVQEALHLLYAGKFYDEFGNIHEIIEGSLENSEAELVMSNIYKNVFGIENESLAEVLKQGEAYFQKQIKQIKAPNNHIYDIAFLKGNGDYTMVTIGNVNTDDSVGEEPITNTITDENGNIILVKGGREVFTVGKWVDIQNDNDVQYNSETGKFVSTKGDILDQTEYRLKDGKPQKRYDFVKRYRVVSKKASKNGIVYQSNVLYKVANIDVFKEAFNTTKDIEAIKKQATIINEIYHASSYKLAQINPIKKFSEGKQNSINNALQFLIADKNVDNNVKEILQLQLNNLSENSKQNIELLTEAKERFLKNEAHEKWVSFQDSLKFISARIPAQTLQSFMAMKLVAWTKNSKNMCYVSHFQTYLQGSDYRHYSV
nr:MAG TPA: hypothetical protein [Caudoviricetes sp.]